MFGKPKLMRSVRDLSFMCVDPRADVMDGGPIPNMPKGFENMEFIMSFIWCMERMWDLKNMRINTHDDDDDDDDEYIQTTIPTATIKF